MKNQIKNLCIKFYTTPYENKKIICLQNKEKSGIYFWYNEINGKFYIGSSINFSRRLSEYLRLKYLKKELTKSNSIIYKALLKYDYTNFIIGILEYCDVNLLIEREQYYIDLLKPPYNILKIANYRLGIKHSTQAMLKFKNRKFSDEALSNIKKAATNRIPSALAKTNQLLNRGHIVTVLNINNRSIKKYPSIRSAAKDLNTNHSSLITYINSKKLFKNQYFITK